MLLEEERTYNHNVSFPKMQHCIYRESMYSPHEVWIPVFTGMTNSMGVVLCLITLLFATHTFAQHAPTLQPPKPDSTIKVERKVQRSAIKELQADVEGLLKSRDFTNAHIGISIISADNGESLYRENDKKNFIPASTLKLFTTAAALDFLGKDFRYYTRVYLDGTTSANGEFNGNIIIRGVGDPTWNSYFNTDAEEIFERWMLKFDSLGISSIKGNIIGDDSYFDNQRYAAGWMWDDMMYPYSAQVNALTADDNCADISVMPGMIAGEPAKIVVKQENRYVRIINNVTTINSNETTDITPYRDPNSNVIELRGRIPLAGKADRAPFQLSVTVDNPTQYVLHLFKQALENHKIRFRGAALSVDDWNERINYTQLEPVCQYVSPPLLNIISVINKHSHNLCAESLLKTLGKEYSGTGSFTKGVEYVTKFLTKYGIQTEDISLVDGSGLSRLNYCTPYQQTQLLWAMHRGDCHNEFASSLAVPGEPGTLRNRAIGTLAEKRIKAKTGSMNGVCTMAGYATTRDNETLCFSVMINNFTVPESVARNLQDLICMRLASFSRK